MTQQFWLVHDKFGPSNLIFPLVMFTLTHNYIIYFFALITWLIRLCNFWINRKQCSESKSNKSLTSFSILAGEINYPKNVQITSTGSSANKQPHRLGHFIKMAGKWMNGRPVWKNKHKNMLFYAGNYFQGGKPHSVRNFSVCLSSNVHICVQYS